MRSKVYAEVSHANPYVPHLKPSVVIAVWVRRGDVHDQMFHSVVFRCVALDFEAPPGKAIEGGALS